jgi:putative Holliday junction resolvase
MRALGLDVGEKTIGLALSDETGMIASPLATLARKGTVADVAAIRALVGEHDVKVLVVGLPIEMNGEEGLRARRVRVLADALAASGLRVEMWDERFSTVAAERVLIEADLSRKRRKEVVDKVAAAYILQGWLDARPRAASPSGEES